MKKLCLMLAVLLMLGTTGCSLVINGKEVTSIDVDFEKNIVEKTDNINIDIDGDTRLQVSNTRGQIVFEKGSGSRIEITAVKKLKDIEDKKKLEKRFKDLKINTTKNNNEVVINVEYLDRLDMLNYQSVELNIKVPEKVKAIKGKSASGSIKTRELAMLKELEINSVSGSVEVESQEAESFELSGISGSIKAENLKGNGSIHTISGSLNLNNINGDVTLKSTSGSINCDDSEIRADASTVSGSIDMENRYLMASSTFSSISGQINLSTEKIDASGSYKLNSGSGSVYLHIPDNQGFSLNAKSMSGSIQCNADLSNSSENDRTPKRLSGTYLNGGCDISMETVSGSISLEKN